MDRIHKIINKSQAVIFYWRAEKGWPVEYVSENISMFGYSKEDFLSGEVSYEGIIHPEDAPRVKKEVMHFTETHQDSFRQVYRVMAPDGAIFWIDDRTVIERDSQGNPEYYLGTIIDITQQKEVENYSALLSNVVEESSSEIYIFDIDSLRFTYLNPAALKHCDLTLKDARTLTPVDITKNLTLVEFKRLLEPLNSGLQKIVRFESLIERKGCTAYPVEVTLKMVDINGRLQYVSVVRNLTERRAIEQERQLQHNYIQSILDGLRDSVMVIGLDYTIEWMNEPVKKMLEVVAISDRSKPKCYEVSHGRTSPCDGAHHPCPLAEVLKSKHEVTVIHNHGNAGVEKFVELSARPLFSQKGEVVSIVESAYDITAFKQAEKKLKEQAEALHFQASHDSLTGLVNRRLFYDLLEQSLRQSTRLGTKLGVVFIDVDKFKTINDTLGHATGDKILRVVAKRLKLCVRASDTVARLGGDEFMILLQGLHHESEASMVLDKIIEIFKEAVDTKSGSIIVSVSMGAAFFPRDSDSYKELIHKADLALYEVKKHGRGSYKFFQDLSKNTPD